MTLELTRTQKYAAHLQSPLWQAQRRGAFSRWGRFCNCCGLNEAIHVHHLNYRDLVDVGPEDLMPLCEECHDIVHSISELDEMARVTGNPMEKRRMVILRLRQMTSAKTRYYRRPAPVAVSTKAERRELRKRAECEERMAEVSALPSHDLIVLTKADIKSFATSKGAYTRSTIEALGLSWTSMKTGWAKRLVGKAISKSAYQAALAGRQIFRTQQ